MGKKNKKSFYKKQLKPFVKENKILLAALGGAAAGITITSLLGAEKAQHLLQTVEHSISNFTDKIAKDRTGDPNGKLYKPEPTREPTATS